MHDDGQLSYREPGLRAFWRALPIGLAMGLAGLLTGKYTRGVLQCLLFTSIGWVYFRYLTRTVLDRRGFERGDHFEWRDVAEARLVKGELKMELRIAGPASLPRYIAEDPRFMNAIREWLPGEHPVRRAIDAARA